MVRVRSNLVEERLEILRSGVESLLVQGRLTADKPFKKTQREALQALRKYLGDESIPAEERLVGYIEIPTGIGKTGLFVSLLSHCQRIADKMGVDFPALIMVSRVDLIDQTIDSMKEYAPGLLENVGQYYFKKKELDKPILLTTYDSWMQLTENGTLKPGDFAMQIPDEAHRVLAVRRQERAAEHRTNGTIDIAFTATGKYDPERTLDHTHKRRIYFKPIKQAVYDGELAEYIETQFFVIRLKPERDKSGKEKFFSGAESERRKQKAWTQTMVNAFVSGVDAMTGEPLTDHQAAFFAGNTHHADITAAALNANPALQAIARKKGCKGVAVAIHTNGINSSRQIELMKAFKRGEYLAVVGDEKFKEGFDHPPLKNIFDYQRGSYVDKAQIIGRASRKFFDPHKNRFVGAVVCDSIIYEGSDDKAEDEWREKKARLNAITAESILEDAVILRKRYVPLIPPPKRPKGTPTVIHLDGVEVEAFCSLEQIKHYVNETRKLRVAAQEGKLHPEGLISLSDEQRDAFGKLLESTGNLGPTRILYLMTQERPALCFDYSELSRLVYGGGILIHPYRFGELCKVLEAYAAALPPEMLQDRFIPFTDDMKREFRELRIARGNPHKDVIYEAAVAWAKKNKKVLADNFGVSTGIMQGKQQTVRQSAWQAIIQGVTSLPVTKPNATADHVLVPYTPEMKRELAKLAKSRGDIGSARLYRMLKEFEAARTELRPVEADVDNVRNLIDPKRIERMKSVYKDVFERAVQTLRAAEEVKKEDAKVVPITPAMYQELQRLMERAGIHGGRTLRQTVESYEQARRLEPSGVSDGLMQSYIQQRYDTTKKSRWKRVIAALKAAA